MATKYLHLFPKPLLEDLVNGRWLPVVGAGMSLNARVPAGQSMPLWPDLEKALEADLDDFSAQGPLDAISAHEHVFGRPRLVERLIEILMVKDSLPGNAHREFCLIPFDIVCTTNFDFLLERQYEALPRFVYPVVDEDQLSLNVSAPGTLLLKLHGDLRHPTRLVATEEDYDAFLTNYPLIATYLANLLITRTAVLIGYSLDDPDFRQVWQVVTQRLGRNRRNAYAIAVDAKNADVARFARRGVTLISLPSSKKNYGEILAQAFSELREHYISSVLSVSAVTEERPLRELKLPRDSLNSLCFFAVPIEQLPLYRERVFPAVEAAGFVPITADDVISPGDSTSAKIEALIDRAVAVVVEPTSKWTEAELQLALIRQRKPRQGFRNDPTVVLIVVPSGDQHSYDVGNHRVLLRPDDWNNDTNEFVDSLLDSLQGSIPGGLQRRNEPQRLLDSGEYRAAVISAMSLLEVELRKRLEKPAWQNVRRPMSMRQLFDKAANENIIQPGIIPKFLDWVHVRNSAVHSNKKITRQLAKQIVDDVESIF